MHQRRRLLALVAALPVLPVLAQGKKYRVAFLGSGSAASVAKPFEALQKEMRELGLANVSIEQRWADGNFERIPKLAEELVRGKPDLLLVWGTPATFAASKLTSSIPIVMCNTGDPDVTGIVKSLSRPGGNITGVANLGGIVVQKQLELLAEVIPGISRIGVLRNPGNASLVTQMGGAETAAKRRGWTLHVANVAKTTDLEPAFAGFAAAKTSVVLVLADPFFFDQGRTIADFAIKNRMPTVSARSEVADRGILMTYGASTVEQFRTAARYVDRILNGAKPGDLPVEQASKFELVVNLKSAKALGVTIPHSVLARADRIIQ